MNESQDIKDTVRLLPPPEGANAGGAAPLVSAPEHAYTVMPAGCGHCGRFGLTGVTMRTTSRSKTGRTLHPNVADDVVTRRITEDASLDPKMRHVVMTNLAHHVFTVKTTVSVETSIAEAGKAEKAMGAAPGGPHTVAKAVLTACMTPTVSEVLDTMNYGSGRRARGPKNDKKKKKNKDKKQGKSDRKWSKSSSASSSSSQSPSGSSSGSGYFAREDRFEGPFLAKGPVDRCALARAIVRAGNVRLPCEQVVVLGGCTDLVSNEFPFPVGISIDGVQSNGEYGRDDSFALVIPAEACTLKDATTLRAPPLNGNTAEYATFVHVDPDAEAKYALEKLKSPGVFGPDQEATYYLPAGLKATVELIVGRRGLDRGAAEMLKARGVLLSDESRGRTQPTATEAGIEYLRARAARLKAKTPAYPITCVYAAVRPSDDTWGGVYEECEKQGASEEQLCAPLCASMRVKLSLCYPDICYAMGKVLQPLYAEEVLAREDRKAKASAASRKGANDDRRPSRRSRRAGRNRNRY